MHALYSDNAKYIETPASSIMFILIICTYLHYKLQQMN